MGVSKKYTSKIANTLFMTVLFLSAKTTSADVLPTEEAVNSWAENAKLITDTFMQQSFRPRMQYEYSGKFLTGDDKEILHELAESASDKLQKIAKKQEMQKQQIENYQGDDWDQKYGSTGLWRKLAGDLFRTAFYKCEIDFYLALASEQPQRNKILHKILTQTDPTFSHVISNAVKLLKIKTLILLAETDPDYKNKAKDALYSPDMNYPGMPCEFYLREQIQKIKFNGKIEPERVNNLTDYFLKTSCSIDFESVLSLAMLQLKSKQFEAFQKTVRNQPKIKAFIGSFALADLSHRTEQQNLEQTSVFEAELAAQTAWKDKTKNYEKLLSCLSNTEKFQTPLILYVTATKLAESSSPEAVNLLIKAGKLQQQKKDNRLNIEPYKIAEQAAQLAYNLFVTDSPNCPLVLEAFDSYYTTAGKKIDKELEYLYTVILNNCNRHTKAEELLKKIADRPDGNWRNRAKLDLILYEMRSNPRQQNKLLEKLGDFILSCRGQDKNSNELRAEAITVYCQSLLESNDKTAAEKVLETLKRTEATDGINLNLLKAKALLQLEKWNESAHYMLLAIEDDSGSLAPTVMKLLAEVIEKIDGFETEPDNPYSLEMMNNCKRLAQFCHSTLNDRQSGLFLAEISILTTDNSSPAELLDHLAEGSKDDNVDLLRCRARLLCKQAEFEKAARLWAKIAKMRKNKTNQQSWKWWRAKFYELYCWSKCPPTKPEDVLHTIEVLENSFSDIPALWSEKLNSLKHLCRNNLSTGK